MQEVEVEQGLLSRQQQRAADRQALKDNRAADRSKAHFRMFETFVMGKSKRERAKKAAAQEREKARVERVDAKAKPLYPKKEEKEQETNASK